MSTFYEGVKGKVQKKSELSSKILPGDSTQVVKLKNQLLGVILTKSPPQSLQKKELYPTQAAFHIL